MTWITWAGPYHARPDGKHKTLCGRFPPSKGTVSWPEGASLAEPPSGRKCAYCGFNARKEQP